MVVTDLRNDFFPCQKKIKEKEKKIYKINRNTRIKQKTSKLKAKENKRYSIIQDNQEMCFLCGQQTKLDKHEAFGGCNRQKSIQWGLVYYICRLCHGKADIDSAVRNYLHGFAKEKFVELYGEDKFLEEFKKNYV